MSRERLPRLHDIAQRKSRQGLDQRMDVVRHAEIGAAFGCIAGFRPSSAQESALRHPCLSICADTRRDLRLQRARRRAIPVDTRLAPFSPPLPSAAGDPGHGTVTPLFPGRARAAHQRSTR